MTAHPGYITAADVVACYDVTIGYVYKLASVKGWRRYTLDGKVRYHLDDVDATLGEDASGLDRNSGKIPP